MYISEINDRKRLKDLTKERLLEECVKRKQATERIWDNIEKVFGYAGLRKLMKETFPMPGTGRIKVNDDHSIEKACAFCAESGWISGKVCTFCMGTGKFNG